MPRPIHTTPAIGALLKTVGTIQRVAEGDQTAVEQCIAHYGGLVWTLARRMTATTADAEDAVQEIFLQLWQQADRFDATLGSEANFVTMIARRRLIDRLRRTQRQPRTETIVEAPSVGEQADLVAVAEEAAVAREKMQQLKPDEQRVLELTLQEGLPQAAVAEKLDLPLGTVKSHARRGLIRLRELMGAGLTPVTAEKGGAR
ncbi:MAG: sigma-70 family RNA polymerase sigma factor [Planctomycetota bacterium]